MNRKQKSNPIYGLVVLTGIVFVITTLGYVVTLVRQQRALEPGEAAVELGPATRFLDQHGEAILLWEAGFLTLFSILAMALDRWRTAQLPASSHSDRDAGGQQEVD